MSIRDHEVDGPGAAGMGTDIWSSAEPAGQAQARLRLLWFHALRTTDRPGHWGLSSSAQPETGFPTLNEAVFP